MSMENLGVYVCVHAVTHEAGFMFCQGRIIGPKLARKAGFQNPNGQPAVEVCCVISEVHHAAPYICQLAKNILSF